MLRRPTSVTLDIVRTVSAQLVVVGHTLGFAYPGERYEYFGRSGITFQSIGVILFFALSGFLIAYTTNLKISSSQYHFSDFMIDRFARIYAGLLPSILFISVLDAIFRAVAPTDFGHYTSFFNFQTFVANALNLQDYPPLFGLMLSPIVATTFGTGIPLWSLAVEWWIYISFGALFLSWDRPMWKRVIITCLLVISLPPALENAIGGRGSGLSFVWLTAAFIAFAFDRIVALYRSTAGWMLLAGLMLLAAHEAPMPLPAGYDLKLSMLFLLALMFSVIAAQVNNVQVPKAIETYAQWFAGYSFTLYLTHYSSVVFVKAVFGLQGTGLLIGGVIVANLVAAILAHFTERHYKRVAAWLRLLTNNAVPQAAAVKRENAPHL